jgi:hypothetical protein
MNKEKLAEEEIKEEIEKEIKKEAKEEDAKIDEVSPITPDVLEKILNRVMVKQDSQAKAAKQLAEQEDNYRLHPDKVAVFEVSQSAIDKIDGTNGWYDIVTGSPKSIELGLSTTVEITEQGLIVTDRFEVKLNRLPQEEWTCEYIIVDRKEWEASKIQAVGAMLDENNQFADIMMRRGAE